MKMSKQPYILVKVGTYTALLNTCDFRPKVLANKNTLKLNELHMLKDKKYTSLSGLQNDFCNKIPHDYFWNNTTRLFVE